MSEIATGNSTMKTGLSTFCLTLLGKASALLYRYPSKLVQFIRFRLYLLWRFVRYGESRSKKFITEVELIHEIAMDHTRVFPNEKYSVGYGHVCPDTIDTLRENGWTITLETGPFGNLFYVFHGIEVDV